MKHSIERSSKQVSMMAGLLFVLAVVLYSCGGGGSYGGGGGGTPAASTVQVVACPVGGTTDILIGNVAVGFSPASATIPINTTVKWTNVDSTLHTVTSGAVPLNGAFDATVGTGVSVCLKFTSAGSFNYHCSIHPTMTGLVTVQ